MLLDGGAKATDFEARRAVLVGMGALQESWKLDPQSVLNKGTLAYMLRVVCHLLPSINERLASPTGLGMRRWALRNCVHVGLLDPGNETDPVTGGELLSAITRAESQRSPQATAVGG
jgi:hypothetical protein